MIEGIERGSKIITVIDTIPTTIIRVSFTETLGSVITTVGILVFVFSDERVSN
jgi:hypothetical protein